jgi:predicted DCC family thiol-disulfide oxidoreductase YuxK
MLQPVRVAAPPSKPVLVFDGDCNFCRRWIARWQRHTGDRVEYVPFQDAQVARRFPEIPREQFEQSVQLVESDGSVYSGPEAVFRVRGWPFDRVPGIAAVAEFAYRQVARHRPVFSWLTRVLWGRHVEPPTHFLTRWIFLRALGLIYLAAFVSLWMQVDGLIGSHGILPAAEMMRQAGEAGLPHNGWGMYWLMPTLCWFNASDGFLNFLCWGGAALSLLVVAGIATAPALLGCWVFYLSLSVVSDVFLGYQWDALLLEVGFLAIFFAPWQLSPRRSRETPPSRLALWLLRWLLFRLMFAAGVVKLASGDATWWNLTALLVHYETQPLPTWIGWYAHQLPVWFQKFSCGAMFVIELGAPFMIFTPRRLRFVGAGAMVFLMALIALTGNYCYFNLLTVALCVLLLDDALVGRVLRTRRAGSWASLPYRAARRDRARHWLLVGLATVIALVTVPQLLARCRLRVKWPKPIVVASTRAYQSVHPFRSVNQYGLFAVMTQTRPEIVVEGSDDGLQWKAYEFKHKPGDLSARPRFCWPHQPRVDWQMWFAALGNYQGNPWFLNFCARLLLGEPDTLALLKTNPFPAAPPRYLRAMVYEYHFTDFAERRATGHWWRRELRGAYCPVLSLRNSNAF